MECGFRASISQLHVLGREPEVAEDADPPFYVADEDAAVWRAIKEGHDARVALGGSRTRYHPKALRAVDALSGPAFAVRISACEVAAAAEIGTGLHQSGLDRGHRKEEPDDARSPNPTTLEGAGYPTTEWLRSERHARIFADESQEGAPAVEARTRACRTCCRDGPSVVVGRGRAR